MKLQLALYCLLALNVSSPEAGAMPASFFPTVSVPYSGTDLTFRKGSGRQRIKKERIRKERKEK